VDWTGAGRGPRLWSFGFLLWAAGAAGMPCVQAVASGYRAHVRLLPEELDRLAGAVAARPLVLDCWSFATGRRRLPELMLERGDAAHAARIAATARAVFEDPAA